MKTLALFALVLLGSQLKAQTPQFVLVHNNTNSVYTTWDATYAQAVDGDNIYLPGVTIPNAITIAKILNIYGAGHYPDSTTATGKTIMIGPITITKKIYIEGLEILNSIDLVDVSANGSSLVRMKIPNLNFGGTEGHFINGCVISYIYSSDLTNCLGPKNLLFVSCILSNFNRIKDSSFENCIFLCPTTSWSYSSCSNTTFKNNIFHGLFEIDWYYSQQCFTLTGNLFYNNLFTRSSIPSNSSGNGNILGVNPSFVLYNIYPFAYNYNFHLPNNSPYLNAGTDGTQIGIYGGTFPYKDGAIPSNPHIYFKNIAPQTNASGVLPIRIKVRSSN
jgi:hypothetical protein